jgi:hypothetical protein
MAVLSCQICSPPTTYVATTGGKRLMKSTR